MIDYEARLEQKELKMAQNLIDSLKEEHKEADYDAIIKKAASLLKLDPQMIPKLESLYIK